MKKKIMISLLACLLIFQTGFMTSAFADEKTEKEMKEAESSIEENKEKLEGVQDVKEDVFSDIKRLGEELESKQAEIDRLTESISTKEAEIEETQTSIDEQKKKIEKRTSDFEQRVRAMYKNGNVGYIDIILSSGNLSELMSNVDMVQKIYTSDQDFLTEMKEVKAETEAKEAKLQAEKIQLTQDQETLTVSKAELDAVKGELDVKYEKLEKQEEEIQAAIVEATKAAEEARKKLEEEERQRKAAEEAKRRAAQQTGVDTSNIPAAQGNGTFLWPTTSTLITANYGQKRSYERHPGIDIGAGYGSPIYAGEAGTVILAGWYGGYGNCVCILHANGLVTLYGHASSLSVGKGQTVSRGQVIAHVGSTGWSTGPHLHFEVRQGFNGGTLNPWNYL